MAKFFRIMISPLVVALQKMIKSLYLLNSEPIPEPSRIVDPYGIMTLPRLNPKRSTSRKTGSAGILSSPFHKKDIEKM